MCRITTRAATSTVASSCTDQSAQQNILRFALKRTMFCWVLAWVQCMRMKSSFFHCLYSLSDVTLALVVVGLFLKTECGNIGRVRMVLSRRRHTPWDPPCDDSIMEYHSPDLYGIKESEIYNFQSRKVWDPVLMVSVQPARGCA